MALRSRLREQWNQPDTGVVAALVAALVVVSGALALVHRGTRGGA